MKVKLISNGMSSGTHLINAETGEKIENVRSVVWSMGTYNSEAGEGYEFVWTGKLVVTFMDVEAELAGELPAEVMGEWRALPRVEDVGEKDVVMLVKARK